MDYTEFKELVKDMILDYLPREYRDSTVSIRKVNKINREKDGLLIEGNGEISKGNILPTIYLNDLYENYLTFGDFSKTLRYAAETIMNASKNVPFNIKDKMNDPERIKSQVIVCLVNTEQNKEMLKEVPHREFNDLSVIYKWIVDVREDGYFNALINNYNMELLDITEPELYEMAMENTKRMLPMEIMSMESIMAGLMIDELGLPDMDFLQQGIEDVLNERYSSNMYVFTNNQKMFGANAMLFEDQLYDFSQKFGGNFYIIPSSIHEVIAVSSKYPVEVLADMVYSANRDEVDISERLSNEIYLYDSNIRKVVLATDVPNKDIYHMKEGYSYGREEPDRNNR